MLLKILDAVGLTQSISTHAQEAIVDSSGVIAASGVSQVAAAASVTRSGFYFQNISAHDMWLNDIAVAAAGQGSIKVPAGGVLSTLNGYPLSTNALNVLGTIGDAYTLKVW